MTQDKDDGMETTAEDRRFIRGEVDSDLSSLVQALLRDFDRSQARVADLEAERDRLRKALEDAEQTFCSEICSAQSSITALQLLGRTPDAAMMQHKLEYLKSKLARYTAALSPVEPDGEGVSASLAANPFAIAHAHRIDDLKALLTSPVEPAGEGKP